MDGENIPQFMRRHLQGGLWARWGERTLSVVRITGRSFIMELLHREGQAVFRCIEGGFSDRHICREYSFNIDFV